MSSCKSLVLFLSVYSASSLPRWLIVCNFGAYFKLVLEVPSNSAIWISPGSWRINNVFPTCGWHLQGSTFQFSKKLTRDDSEKEIFQPDTPKKTKRNVIYIWPCGCPRIFYEVVIVSFIKTSSAATGKCMTFLFAFFGVKHPVETLFPPFLNAIFFLGGGSGRWPTH